MKNLDWIYLVGFSNKKKSVLLKEFFEPPAPHPPNWSYFRPLGFT